MVCKYCGGYSPDDSRCCSTCGRPFAEASHSQPRNESDSSYAADSAQNRAQPNDFRNEGYQGGYSQQYNERSEPYSANAYDSNAAGYNNNNPKYQSNEAQYSYSSAYNTQPASRLYSDADTAHTMALMGLIVGICFNKIAGIVLGALAIAKINKCLAYRDEPAFRSTQKMAKIAVIVNSVLLGLIFISLILYIVLIAFLASSQSSLLSDFGEYFAYAVDGFVSIGEYLHNML